MTKNQAIERNAAWSKALAEGRVVRWNDGMTLTSYPTELLALAAVQDIKLAGMDAEIVKVPS
jgi:hypothetical protein